MNILQYLKSDSTKGSCIGILCEKCKFYKNNMCMDIKERPYRKIIFQK